MYKMSLGCEGSWKFHLLQVGKWRDGGSGSIGLLAMVPSVSSPWCVGSEEVWMQMEVA